MDFEKELAALLNKHNWDGRTNTPDFMLAFFLVGILERLNITMYRRKLWSIDTESGKIVKADHDSPFPGVRKLSNAEVMEMVECAKEQAGNGEQ